MPHSAQPGRALPAPGPDARRISETLSARIRAEIADAGGVLSFARYMELALYAPGLGYYSAGATRFGEGGDFTTAPERTPLFARCLAVQCAEVLAELDEGTILEFGAGSGALAAELLRSLDRVDQLPARYLILERGAGPRAAQEGAIGTLAPRLRNRVTWLDALPEEVSGVVIANEVLDAMPVELFRIATGGAVEAVVVTEESGQLKLRAVPAPSSLVNTVRALEQTLGAPLPIGFSSEVRPTLAPWVRGLGDCVKAGMVLVIDYGLPRRELYAPERGTGTLLCHYRHRVHDDPLYWPGLQDIGAWVDFTGVVEAGIEAGFELAGFTTQAHFLLGCRIERRMLEAQNDPGADPQALARQVQVLTLPGEMGERFRVLGLTRGVDRLWCGFSGRDLSGTL